MKPFFKVQTLEHVLDRMRTIPPLGTETVGLAEAPGRTLADDFRAPHDLPGFDRSAMDGYAVRARDTFGASESEPGYLELQGEVMMGRAPDFTLTPKHCARIGTGGMLPAGADAVVMVEHTRDAEPTLVEVSRPVAPGAHVLGASDDAAAGEVVLRSGQRLRPQDVGMLAAFGVTAPLVRRRPRVAILSTGDEVVPADARPAPGQVRDVNAHVLTALVLASGAEPVPLGLVRDDAGRLRTAVQRGVAEADLTLLSGGSSVGTRDLTAEVFLEAPDAELLVQGVSVAPGKPFIWVRSGRHHLLGLPGHVTSCMVAFHLFAEPILERLHGREARPFQRFGRVEARLTRNVPSAPGRTLFQRVFLSRSEHGWDAEPVPGRSGLLRSLVRGNGLVLVPLGHEGLDAGAAVEVLLFPEAALDGETP